MTLMLAAASICTTDALERHLAPPGFECCERELLGRPWRRDWGMRNFDILYGSVICSTCRLAGTAGTIIFLFFKHTQRWTQCDPPSLA